MEVSYMDKIIIRMLPLPGKVKGITVLDENCDYNVYINSVHAPDIQKQAVEHELRHIQKEHFFTCGSVAENEYEAESSLLNIKEEALGL